MLRCFSSSARGCEVDRLYGASIVTPLLNASNVASRSLIKIMTAA
jgi:hypothetical protein